MSLEEKFNIDLGKLIFIDERADTNFRALGMTYQVLKCDAPECRKLTSV